MARSGIPLCAAGDGGMMARRGLFGVLAGGAAVLVSGCGLIGNDSYRFRMTVEVGTPQGVKSGASVYAVRSVRAIRITAHEGRGSVSMRGEAVVVDLATGPIFVLLHGRDDASGLTQAVTDALAGRTSRSFDELVANVGQLGGWFSSAKAELPRKDWPMMVRFRDMNDPKSVELVDPDSIGVMRILLETTGDEVTTGIHKRLGWLPNQNGSFVRRLSVPDSTNPPIAAILNKRDFSTELK